MFLQLLMKVPTIWIPLCHVWYLNVYLTAPIDVPSRIVFRHETNSQLNWRWGWVTCLSPHDGVAITPCFSWVRPVYGAEVVVGNEEERTPGETAEQQGGTGSWVPGVFGEFSYGAETCKQWSVPPPSPVACPGGWREWGTNYNPVPVWSYQQHGRPTPR